MYKPLFPHNKKPKKKNKKKKTPPNNVIFLDKLGGRFPFE
jgi:homospermidine synthase